MKQRILLWLLGSQDRITVHSPSPPCVFPSPSLSISSAISSRYHSRTGQRFGKGANKKRRGAGLYIPNRGGFREFFSRCLQGLTTGPISCPHRLTLLCLAETETCRGAALKFSAVIKPDNANPSMNWRFVSWPRDMTCDM